MEIHMNDAQMRQLVSAAIFEHIDASDRDKLLKDAIVHLLTPERSHYGGQERSPLQRAMTMAVENIARELVAEYLAQPERRAQLLGVVTEAFDKVMSDGEPRTALINTLSEAIGRAFQPKSSY